MISLLFVKSSLLVLAALGVTFALRSTSAAVRSACWTTLAVLLLVLPVAARYAPRVSIDVPVAAASPLEPAVPAVNASGGDDRVGVTIQIALASVWLAGALVLLGGFALSLVRARAIVRRSTPVSDASATAIRMRVLVSNLAIRRRVRVLTSVEVDVPLTGGLVSPYIILPESSSGWDSALVQSVLVHELAHIARWDYATHAVFEVVRALYWPNPLVWRAMSSATMERERAADDRVLASGANPAAYATDLLDFASGPVRVPSHRGALGIAASALKTRIRAILRAGVSREHATAGQLATIAAVGLVGLVLVAGLTFSARATVRGVVNAAPAIVATQADEQIRPRQVIARRSDQYFVMRTVGSSRGDSLLFVLINAKKPRVRLAAAQSLRTDGADVPVIDVLVSALADTCHADRWLATRALRELRAKRALPNLVKQLVEDEYVAVRSMAASAIATAGVSEGAALLRTAIDGAESAQVARVTRALDTLGETSAHAQLANAVRRASR